MTTSRLTMGRLEERVIIVTGGAHGLGRAYCEGLAREGARVVVADIDGRGAETVAETLSTGGQEALAPGLTMSMEDESEARTGQSQQRLQARAIQRAEVPQDLVGTVVFLCSSNSDFMTGQTLVVDGGAQMH